MTRRHTDPIWLQDHFLATGHDVTTRNATGTFIKFGGSYYVVTCRHVLHARLDPEVVPGAAHPTLALHLDKAVLNLSGFTAGGFEVAVRAPTGQMEKRPVDVALTRLPAHWWELLQSKKDKQAIDLDTWEPPKKRPEVTMCVAAGCPDEHKTIVTIDGEDKVGVQLTEAVAELADPVTGAEDTFRLSSRLERPHDTFFSGMSGGPVYAISGQAGEVAEEADLKFVGLTFEGAPASHRNPPHDLLPTVLAVAGDTQVKDKLSKGYKVGDMTYKVHVDGDNLVPYLTGQAPKSPRESFFTSTTTSK